SGPFFGVYIGYLAPAEWLFGTTLGKYTMGLSVVSDSGQRPSLWAVLVRNLVGFYERLPLTFVIAVPMILLGPRRQRVGDLLARTFVVQKEALEGFKKQRARARPSDDQLPAGELLPPVEMKFWGITKRKQKNGDEKPPDEK
ncbi:MAG: RDD family protein, partial [Planctomycetota bacterium]